MNTNSYLFAAYIVTWVIHIGYILILSGRARRIREEARELERLKRR